MPDNMDMMGAIAKGIVNDDALSDGNWTEASIVFSFEDDGFCSGHYGYAYDSDGKPRAFTLDSMDAELAASAYREWLQIEGDKGFKKMLFQFNRETRKVNAEFEFENTSRWQVTPKNIDTITEQLRPNLRN